MWLQCFDIFTFLKLEPDLHQPSTSATSSSNALSTNADNTDDCGPNCRFRREYLDGHVLETNGWMKAFEQRKKTDDKKRPNLCARIDAKLTDRSFILLAII